MSQMWRNSGMSMRNPMSRAPMNNNPMGVQAPNTMQPPQHRYASRGVTPGSMIGQFNRSPGMTPDDVGGMAYQKGVSPDEFRVGMGGQAMYSPGRAIGMAQANGGALNGLSGGSLTRSSDQVWSRRARQAGVRPQDMAAWRQMKMAEAGQGMVAQGPPGGRPVAMGSPQLALNGEQGPSQIAPPAWRGNPQASAAPAFPATENSYTGSSAIERSFMRNAYGRRPAINPIAPGNMPPGASPLVTSRPLSMTGALNPSEMDQVQARRRFPVLNPQFMGSY